MSSPQTVLLGALAVHATSLLAVIDRAAPKHMLLVEDYLPRPGRLRPRVRGRRF
jgi:hypothetical protein